MSRLLPHKAEPKVKALQVPVLFFTEEAMFKMQCYIEECDGEVGWLGTVTDHGKGHYLCDNVYLLHQQVHGATTELTPEGLVAFAEEVGFETMETARLWGHSHVKMGTSPSAQDNEQVKMFKDNGLPWTFRIIANKHGVLTATFYDFVQGIEVYDTPWEVYTPDNIEKRDEIKAEIGLKVKPLVAAQQYSWGGGGGRQWPVAWYTKEDEIVVVDGKVALAEKNEVAEIDEDDADDDTADFFVAQQLYGVAYDDWLKLDTNADFLLMQHQYGYSKLDYIDELACKI